MKATAIIGGLGALAGVAWILSGSKKKPSKEALIDGVWIFGAIDDQQVGRVTRTFERTGQVLSSHWDGSLLGLKVRLQRQYVGIAAPNGYLQAEYDLGLQLLTEPDEA